jgi:hypothetical protein
VTWRVHGAARFCRGLAPVRLNHAWGYWDEQGNVVIPPQYGGASAFGPDGTAEVFRFTDRALCQGVTERIRDPR